MLEELSSPENVETCEKIEQNCRFNVVGKSFEKKYKYFNWYLHPIAKKKKSLLLFLDCLDILASESKSFVHLAVATRILLSLKISIMLW